jgi:crotonobetainyl-CoA:carnitine CoA-transferase CaiB-like acyl-CoA transferase
MLEARNKRSVAIDLKHPEGRKTLHRMIPETDIFITNMPLKVRHRLGIGYADLSPLNSKLIYASFTGYGERGAEMHKPGFDSTAWWARSGLMDQVRAEHGAAPARSLPGMGDHMAAVSLFAAIATALYRREQTGKGGEVGSSLLANGAWSNSCFVQAALSGAKFVERPPRAKAGNALSNHYLCGDDRWILLSVSIAQEEKSWAKFAACLGRPDLSKDPRFKTRSDRHKHAEKLIAEMDKAFLAKGADAWQKILEAEAFAVSVVARATDTPDDAQMLATGVLVPMRGAGGRDMTVSSPFWLTDVAKVPARRAPELGQHTDEVLRASGLSVSEIAALRKAGAVG